jgi:hypothetical protein
VATDWRERPVMGETRGVEGSIPTRHRRHHG